MKKTLILSLILSLLLSMTALADEVVVGSGTNTADSLLNEEESSSSDVIVPTESVAETQDIPQETTEYSENTSTEDNALDSLINIEGGTVDVNSDIQIEDVVEYTKEKGWDILKVIQVGGAVLCVIFFVISLIILCCGIVNKRLLAKGIIGMLISAICFCCILFGPQLISAIKSFLVSK